jgi:GTP1/Obg family GTP-binding protein
MYRLKSLFISLATVGMLTVPSIAQAGEGHDGDVCHMSPEFVAQHAADLGVDRRTTKKIERKVARASKKTDKLKEEYYSAVDQGEDSTEFVAATDALMKHIGKVKASVESLLTKAQMNRLSQLREQTAAKQTSQKASS